MHEHEVVVTGVGPVTPVGTGAAPFWQALREGRQHVVDRRLAVDLGREVDLPMAAMAGAAPADGLDRQFEKLDGTDVAGHRDLAYSLLAIELALGDAGLSLDGIGTRAGMIQAYEAPGVECAVGALFEMFSAPPPTSGPPPVYELLAQRFYNMQPFMYVHVVAKIFGLHGFCTNVHNACSSGAFALEVAASRIRDGQADAMIVVAGEAFETAVRLEWFRRLSLYAGSHQMRPFDPEPSGFYVGEGAIALVLESAAAAERRGAQPYARYAGASFVHQGWKQTLPDVRSARLKSVIGEALSRCAVSPGDIDLVVPHAACTSLSDSYEANCAGEALGEAAAGSRVCAFKPNVGHWLAGSGLIETAAGLLAMRHGELPPTLHSPAGRCAGKLPLNVELTERRVRHLLKLSTGFTGHDAATIFAAC